MAFNGALRRLILNGLSWRDYCRRFGQPCESAKAAFRDADNALARLTPQAYIETDHIDELPRPYSGAIRDKRINWDTDLVEFVVAEVARGVSKKRVAEQLTATKGIKVTRYHVANICKKHKNARGGG